MRLLLISDIHANPWALEAVANDAGLVDYVLCAGDVVTYGPCPSACIAWLQHKHAIVVRGNHDQAAAFGTHPHAAPEKATLALAMRDWTRNTLTRSDLHWLCHLPIRLIWEGEETSVEVLHATPIDPLYDYRLRPDIPWDQFSALMYANHGADVLLVGHTHLALQRTFVKTLVVNPGSVGQPLDGDPRASYAIWENGVVSIHRVDYDREPIIKDLSALPLAKDIVGHLISTLETGRIS